MVSVGVVVEGFILAIIFTVVLAILGVGSVLGLSVALFGFLIAGIIVGYISYGNIFDGTINGALMGVAGAIILWLLSLFKGQIAAFSAQLSMYLPLNSPQEIIIIIVVGAIGGAVGSLILRFNRRNRRYDEDRRDEVDRRD
ncbi:DUF5518 domain-containing protein [Methanobacterium aggregans]|uniref:DUF5518 domain-containing protein n=1 Tax=Methanobacterium aggregans TaxID=1615586 RepID=UPI001AEB57AB|nr:DUF5518 domain-containing protein [Methanobacterium aggregans]MBP2046817.1 hypothetical protein [Methanobacterium aggregans]